MLFAKIKLAGCNLDCAYCPPRNRGKSNDFDKIIAYIDAIVRSDITEIKWSGGEPTVYKRFIELLRYAKQKGLYQSVTTNGTCTSQYLADMRSSGVSRLNISLDTLDRTKFKSITGKDLLSVVLRNIEQASVIFPDVIKINVTVFDENIQDVSALYDKYKGNHKVIPRFLQLTYKGDDSYTEKHRRDNHSSVLDFLPEAKSTPRYDRVFTNPVAQLYKVGPGDYFNLIPQMHDPTCIAFPSPFPGETDDSDIPTCNKIWFSDGEIFACKMAKDERKPLQKNNAYAQVRQMIIDKCTCLKPKLRIHRMQNAV